MQAELKSLFSLDALEGLERYVPSESDWFSLRTQAFIGPPGEPHGTSFDFTTCSFRWLAANYTSVRGWTRGSLLGRGLVMLARWDFNLLKGVVNDICEDVEGPDWESVALQISQWLPWEFEYRYDTERNRPSNSPGLQ